jgi:hypothetical protein
MNDPKIMREEINGASTNWEFIDLLIDKYSIIYERQLKITSAEKAREILTENQIVLIRFSVLHGQVCNGGYFQFFSNGNGRILERYDFCDNLKKWGATNIANITNSAFKLYLLHRDGIDREKTIEEYLDLEKSLTGFQEMDSEFYTFMDLETEQIVKHIKNNLNNFINVC